MNPRERLTRLREKFLQLPDKDQLSVIFFVLGVGMAAPAYAYAVIDWLGDKQLNSGGDLAVVLGAAVITIFFSSSLMAQHGFFDPRPRN